MIDSLLRQIERLEVRIRKITSNTDIQSLSSIINDLSIKVNNTSDIVKNFKYIGSSSDEIRDIVASLQSFNQIAQMIYTLGNKSIKVYIKLKQSGQNVDSWIKSHLNKLNNDVSLQSIQIFHDRLFGDDMLITPNCNNEYIECPYYRLSEIINEIHDKINDSQKS